MFGYAGKLLFVDLSTGTVEVRPLREEDARNFVGGPALGAKILYEEMPPKADVFGEDSMIGFVTGPLNGTRALFGGRYTVVSKSPVTGGWNDANSGGSFGPCLKKAGFDGVFVRGIAKEPTYIFIDSGEVSLCSAADLWGKTTLEAEAMLRERYGDKINAALISPAGEKLSLLGCVMNDGHRAAGRGGSGAVMGSKRLKAVVVRGNLEVPVYDEARIKQLNTGVAKHMKGPAIGMATNFGAYGTGGGYVNSVLSGDACVKNWGGAGVVDYPEEVAFPVGSRGIDSTKTRQYRCSMCPLGCGAFHDMPSKRWNLMDSPRPEYETQGSFGSQMLNGDTESVFQCNNLCNEYGVDTISTGATVAWAMECFENGVLSLEELDGVPLNWGNGDAIVAITEKICKVEGCGTILAKGSQVAADTFGKGHEYLVVARGIEEPQHDSRLAYGLARTYQYDPTPGRHVKGGLGMGPKHTTGHNFDYRGTGFRDAAGVSSKELCNASGYCMFGQSCSPAGTIAEQFMAATGFRYTPLEIHALGLRSYTMRHAFNLREGLRRKDFTLSKRFVESDPPFEGPLAGIKVDNELLADNFFNAMGWDMDSVPLPEALALLGGLEQVQHDLYPPKEA